MRKDAEEQKKLYCKQMKEMALEDRLKWLESRMNDNE